MRLDNKTTLVTGGGSGIGRAIAERFAAEGARVVIVDRAAARAESTAAHITQAGGVALAVAADVASSAAVADMIARALAAFGSVDILVNNAAISGGDDMLTIDESTWDAHLAVNLKSVFLYAAAHAGAA